MRDEQQRGARLLHHAAQRGHHPLLRQRVEAQCRRVVEDDARRRQQRTQLGDTSERRGEKALRTASAAPMRWRQRVIEERSSGRACWTWLSPQKSWT
jgi:hypothetical protein